MAFGAQAQNAPCSAPNEGTGIHRTLHFKFFPAADPPNSPLLILFHGWSGQPYDWKDPAWNVLCPWDCFGVARNGCWWLGEDGDYFMANLLDNAVNKVMADHGVRREIYCWGTSMGGFGALHHGMRWKAKAICANVPQVRLLGTDYYTRYAKMLNKVFGEDIRSPLGDVTNMLDRGDPTNNPMFFIVQSRFDMHERYTKEQCFHLINALNHYNINYYLGILPVKGHEIFIRPDQAVQLFGQYRASIDEPFTF